MGFLDNMRYQMGNAIGLPRPNNMAAGRRAERSVPMPTPEQATAMIQAMRAQQQQQEAQQQQQALPIDPMTGMPNLVPRYAPNVGPHTMADARQQEIAARNANPLVPQAQKPVATVPAPAGGAPAGGGTIQLSPANGGGTAPIPTPPQRPAEFGGTGQPMYYTMDPGDGGILRTFLSKDGKPPEMFGYSVAGSQPVPQDQGILAKILRGAF